MRFTPGMKMRRLNAGTRRRRAPIDFALSARREKQAPGIQEPYALLVLNSRCVLLVAWAASAAHEVDRYRRKRLCVLASRRWDAAKIF
jgi:hypothetical protein